VQADHLTRRQSAAEGEQVSTQAKTKRIDEKWKYDIKIRKTKRGVLLEPVMIGR
jgi:hypothetical protein